MMKPHFFLFIAFLLLVSAARASIPIIRLKAGISNLTVNAGELYQDEPLSSMITFQPSLLWDFPSFSSRIGIHYLQELSSSHGTTPLSGIGISGYYHILGISSSYQMSDDVVVQRSKPGPYLVASYTPVNVNMNKFVQGVGAEDNKYFSAYCNEFAGGVGFDYPLLQNMLLSGEILFRNGSSSASQGPDGASSSVNYSGLTVFLTFAAAYY